MYVICDILKVLFCFYQGSVGGPHQFAAGLANGIKSLLGHTIGKERGEAIIKRVYYQKYFINLNSRDSCAFFLSFNFTLSSRLSDMKLFYSTHVLSTVYNIYSIFLSNISR